MTSEFELSVDGEYPAPPERIWKAVTADTAAWLFPSEGMGGEDVVAEEPHHRINRIDGPDGWFNQLEQVIEERSDGRSFMRWVHSGVFVDDWDAQYDGARKHTAFYLHTLGQYLEFFDGRPVTFVDVQGPKASMDPGAFELLRNELGLSTDSSGRTTSGADLPGIVAGTAEVDFSNENFIGIRTADALYRFFGRNAFGGPIGITVHHFGVTDAETLAANWQRWIGDLFADR